MGINSTVIDSGFCIGCGSCVAMEPSKYSMEWNEYGLLNAKLIGSSDSDSSLADRVCPFSDNSENETVLGAELFSNFGCESDQYIGNYLEVFAGHAADESIRSVSTSGGMLRSLAGLLIESGEIDYFITVEESDLGDGQLFQFNVFNTRQQVLDASRAAYHPVSMDDVLSYIAENEGVYAISALPCFSKSLRLIQRENDLFRERIKYVFGIICGGLKSANYAHFIAGQYDVPFSGLKNIDFRYKHPDKVSARQQASRIICTDADGHEACHTKPNSEVVGLDYGMGLFKPLACDFCDDVVGETADISIGDAWLPEFEKDSGGDSLMIVRSPALLSLIKNAYSEGRLVLIPLTAADAFKSQEAGFRHRRDGLAHRLSTPLNIGSWKPKKREFLLGGVKNSPKQKEIFERRFKISVESHKKYLEFTQNDDFHGFVSWVKDITESYKRLKRPSFFSRVVNKLNVFSRVFLKG